MNTTARNESFGSDLFTSDVKKYLYFARIEHPNEAIYGENILGFCSSAGIPAREIILKHDRALRFELKECLSDAFAVVSTNWHLDHSWLEDRPFLFAAADRGVPVIQWMIDHPSHLWHRFERTNADNSRFVFESVYAEAYFRKFIIPDCRSARTVGIGPNWRSRTPELTFADFQTRAISCLVPLNLRRVSGTVEEIACGTASLPIELREPVLEAIDRIYYDLQEPIEKHLLSATALVGLAEELPKLHDCVRLIEDAVQIKRRLKVFEVAREFPVLLQSDVASNYLPDRGSAVIEERVSMAETYTRMRQAKAVISLSPVNSEIHDRTLNALNAGAVNIMEDNKVHRAFFKHGENALLFRYDDDSLREALDLVCSKPARAFEIAEAGFALRDDPRLRFGGFDNFLTLSRD